MLLPAGTITISGRFILEDIRPQFRTNDGWYQLPNPQVLQGCVNDTPTATVLQNLQFLVTNSFLSLTCRISDDLDQLIVRVYLIPFDLPGMRGRLRNRDEATILIPARRILKFLLRRVNCDVESWMGTNSKGPDITCTSSVPYPFLSPKCDQRTLAEIYSELPSPVLPPTSKLDVHAAEVIQSETIPGMRSHLYPYQRESVATMLEKEGRALVIPDPLYTPIKGIDGRDFYYQPATMEILREQPMSSQSRGGILCEELGTGKTVMMLAVILATIDVLPCPEECLDDDRPILTPLAFQHFPHAKYKFIRQRTSTYNDIRQQSEIRIPSLVDTVIDYIRTTPPRVGLHQYKDNLEEIGLWDDILANQPFYLQFPSEAFRRDASRKKSQSPPPAVIFLSAATLIVVPQNLLGQWDSEIMKHCEMSLRILVVKSDVKLPPPKELASKYDIILMTTTRFTLEAPANDTSKLHTGYTCMCPLSDRTHVPKCKCTGVTDVSSLLQVRWKRLVVDEGHNAGTSSSVLTAFAKQLSVERRWIVTGTPTTNLRGLGFGQNSEALPDEQEDVLPEPDVGTPIPHPKRSTDDLAVRVWTSEDGRDLRKFANMMINFLGVPRFAVEPKTFSCLVRTPLFDPDGPQSGAVDVLTQVMSSVMVRHRIEDVEKHIMLPPINQEVVLLDLDPYALKTYNVLLAGIAINAIDSERRDIDYLFHPRNVKRVSETMDNITQALFWHVDPNTFDKELQQTVGRAEKAQQNASERNQPVRDIIMIAKARYHLTLAASDDIWRSFQSGLEVPYRVHGMPLRLRHPWGIVPGQPDDMPLFLYPLRAMRLRDAVVTKPLSTEERLVEYADFVRAAEEAVIAREKSKLRKKSSRSHHAEEDSAKLMSRGVMSAMESKKKAEEFQNEVKLAHERLKAFFQDDDHEGQHSTHRVSVPGSAIDNDRGDRSHLYATSPLAAVQIRNSTSTKLNYILNEVLQHAPEEKILIFSKMPFTLSHIAEGLELIGVKSLLFTAEQLPKARQQLVMTFETSDKYRVFLMELRHGARGLNLVSASRVIFCEPVWHGDVESQAIKRVHRIGQTRPINVKILAVRSTFEEEIARRRETLKMSAAEKRPEMASDTGIRKFIEVGSHCKT
ncbi:hypothetical protein BD410DRAFT_851421 [Rickenella mellea]|uniref:P-loop containing nucleoside triphosphate hydrolase protein n=1 Tax=Rickenella mellea TaxID=50990 RepID=A0A4Y7QCE8_9AGAM|nr:hypothetical protein BD410DRAFT_851421 [Rickenella mellea]